MPASAARSRMAAEVASSHWSPKVIVPQAQPGHLQAGPAHSRVLHTPHVTCRLPGHSVAG